MSPGRLSYGIRCRPRILASPEAAAVEAEAVEPGSVVEDLAADSEAVAEWDPAAWAARRCLEAQQGLAAQPGQVTHRDIRIVHQDCPIESGGVSYPFFSPPM